MKTRSVRSPFHPHAWVYDAQMAHYSACERARRKGRNPDLDTDVLACRWHWITAIERGKKAMIADAGKTFEEVGDFLSGIWTYFERHPEKLP